jgi:Fur family ferric uptake transcriptional regulator
LRTAGLRITEQRRSILRVLAKAEGTLSAEETFEALDPDTCDVVTVYRCLESFERAGTVQRGVRENGTKVYCLAHGADHHQLAEERGFVEVSHVLEVFGVCSDCREGGGAAE